ncbi:MAG: aspartyl protease family protein [Candidatus Eremiobacteraeota bacterium]|nr:aspartyl protease family protein [Candidatus Eremiobacteraeota bacterium]
MRTTPLRLSPYELLYVSVAINGQKAVAMIDTGSFIALQVSQALADRLRLTTVPSNISMEGYDFGKIRLKLARINSLELGGVKQATKEVAVSDRIAPVAEEVGTPFEAILGMGFFARRDVVIDYKALQLRLDDRPDSRGVIDLPLEIVNFAPIVPGSADGKAVKFLVDTGAPTCILDSTTFSLKANTFAEREIRLGDRTQGMRCLGQDLTLNKPLGISGIIGNNLLKQYAVSFNHADDRLELS